jgi:hypothetical protein
MTHLLMQLSDSVVNTHHEAGWRITPTDRDKLVRMHQIGERLVRTNTTRDTYLKAVDYYLHRLVQMHIFPDKDRESLLRALAMTKDKATARAVFHRINCQTLRFLSELCECTQPCCCTCAANYPNIACNALRVNSHNCGDCANCEDYDTCGDEDDDCDEENGEDGSGMGN